MGPKKVIMGLGVTGCVFGFSLAMFGDSDDKLGAVILVSGISGAERSYSS